LFVANRTTTLTDPPAAMAPAEHDTDISETGNADGMQGFGVGGVGGGFEKTFEPFTKSAMLLTVTAD
jgi:hypothetical protein